MSASYDILAERSCEYWNQSIFTEPGDRYRVGSDLSDVAPLVSTYLIETLAQSFSITKHLDVAIVAEAET